MGALERCELPVTDSNGVTIGHVSIIAEDASSLSIVEVPEELAREFGQTVFQLRESATYEFAVTAAHDRDLRLRCSLAKRRLSLSDTDPDAGRIETRNWCGTLLLELVEGEADGSVPAVGSTMIEVRSIKLDYRQEYRGMLRDIAERLTGLVVDARSSTKVSFRSNFQERSDSGWLHVQLELLREVLESSDFAAAVQRVISFPHERLAAESERVPTNQPIRWSPKNIRQLVCGLPRRALPETHALRLRTSLISVAEAITVTRRVRDLDTPENRFVKAALRTFLAFLAHASAVFEGKAAWKTSSELCRRLASIVEGWLSRAFFQEVGDLQAVPLGSPVLQRKGGYREILRWWLRFQTAAEISWTGGEELFRAGQRDVATLYEYWLFFQLLDWFSTNCMGGRRAEIEQLVVGLEEGSPTLRLKQRLQLGPFSGSFCDTTRSLNARFTYNRRFERTNDRQLPGSWTRQLHPDYTLSFWPRDMEENEAESRELLVHIHLDSKYRVENVQGLFGVDLEEPLADDADPAYHRVDLLKMHAYRDAIKRSQGAYVLYPGVEEKPETFSGFHELLPGLGAFAIRPDENGNAIGMEALGSFLRSVLHHLVNRTTARERATYHLAEAYRTKEAPVAYGSLTLPDSDLFGSEFSALPPAEHMVLLAWYRGEAQRALAESTEGFTFIRLGRRAGSFHVHPNVASVRHILLRSDNRNVATGLLKLREPGFRVYTRAQLRKELNARAGVSGVAAWQTAAADDDEEHIYALFSTSADPSFAHALWDGDQVLRLIEAFEQDRRNAPVENLGRSSAYPRIVALQQLLKALKPQTPLSGDMTASSSGRH